MASLLPDDWIKVDGTSIIVKWGEIFLGLIGAPLVAIAVGIVNVPLSLFGALQRVLETISAAFGALILLVFEGQTTSIEQGFQATTNALEGLGPAGFVLGIVLVGVIIYTAGQAVTLLTGADG